MTYRQVLQEIARSSHGVVTTQQAREAGIPAVELRKIAARGFLHRIGHGAYRALLVPATPYTPYAEALAIAGSHSYLGPASTLSIHGLIRCRRVIDVCVPRWPTRVVVPHVDVTRRIRCSCELTMVRGIPALTLVAALADYRPEYPEQGVGIVLDTARVTGRISEEEWNRVREVRHQRGWKDC